MVEWGGSIIKVMKKLRKKKHLSSPVNIDLIAKHKAEHMRLMYRFVEQSDCWGAFGL